MTANTQSKAIVRVVDDDPDVRRSWQFVIEGEGWNVLTYASALEFLEKDSPFTPGCLVLDVRMPGMDGLEATSRISALEAAAGDAPRKTRVIILTTFDLDEYVMAAINAGASGFLLKDTEPETLLSSIRTVYQGNAIIAPSATKRLIEKMMEDGYTKHGLTATDGYADGSSTMPGARPVAYTDPELNLLTEREREVLVEIAHGLSNQEIADKLFISLPTVKTHVAHILSKINARDRVQAVVFAYENHLV